MGNAGAVLPFLGMVMVVLAQVSNMEVSKVAMSRGINRYVIIVYSNALSTLFFLPFSHLFHRSERPPLTFSILFRFFLLSLIGVAAQILGYGGIQYSSPTLGTALLNLIPAFTFSLALTFRMETLDWKSRSSQAKTLGTLVSITGAFVVTFYKGPPILLTPSLTVSTHRLLLAPRSNWILGGLCFAAEALLVSAWYILQALTIKKFPTVFTIIFYSCFFSTILSAAFSLTVVNDPSVWRLRLDMGMAAILYSAVVGTGFSLSLCTWCLWRTGPLYISMFKPLAIIFAIAMGVILLGDALCLGSLIGALIIVTGFYAVMWGKAKEEKTSEECEVGRNKSSTNKVPLLQNKTEDHI